MTKHFLILLSLLGATLQAETLTGTCKRVVDGDTLHLEDGTKVQIWGIDAPEKGQPYADKATAYLEKTTKGRELTIKVRETDKLGRTVADVSAGKTDLALFMVRSGMAWHDDYNAPDATKLAEAMKKARQAKKGLWADKAPVKPYLFRKGGQPQTEPASEEEVICHYVQDGDTFKLPDDETRVRLWGIDAPEKGQAHADKSRARLKELCEGKSVRLEMKDTDQYGRKVAIVWLGKKNINLQMVKEGMAWHYAHYAPDAADLAAAEKAARKARKGLWKDKNPINPYEFRKQSR